MPRLIFVIGATAAGKTYFIEQNYRDKDVDILNVYDYQQKAYDEVRVGDSIPLVHSFDVYTKPMKCCCRISSKN